VVTAYSNQMSWQSGKHADFLSGTPTPSKVYVQTVHKDGGAHGYQVLVKTPKYSCKVDWEAFHAQFKLLARVSSGLVGQ